MADQHRGRPVDDEESKHGKKHAELLAKADLFAGLDRVTLARLAANLDRVSFTRGEAACVQGEAGDSLYLVSEGTFGIFVTGPDGRREVRVATLGRGGCFGEMALLTGEPRSATVRADGEGELLRLEHDRFAELLRHDPSIGLALSATLSRRLHMASQSLMQVEEMFRCMLESQIARLPASLRTRVLQASLLHDVCPAVLTAAFGREAAQVAAQLNEMGWRDGKPPEPIVRMMRDIHEREAGPEAVRAFALEAVDRLAEAGRWHDALALADSTLERSTFAALLGRALRTQPSMPREQAFRWVERLTDDEAAADVLLTVERAAWHETRAMPGAAVALLQRALKSSSMAGDEAATRRFQSDIARLLPSLAPPSATSQASRIDLRSIRQRWRSRRFRLIAAGASILLILGAVAASPVSKPAAFMLLLGGAIALWVLAILPEFVVYLGLVIAWVVLGIAKPAQAIAGFGSPSWISVFAILAIASALSASGLVYRLGLLLVRHLPEGLVRQGVMCLGSGLLLTLLVPSSTARARLLLPTALTAAQAQRFKDHSPESAFLGMAAFIGAAPLLYTFLNGSSSNFLGLGLMPEDSRARFDLAFWFIAAAPLAAFVSIGSLAMLWLVLRPSTIESISHSRVDLQLSLLGRLSGQEIAMAIILCAMVIGWNIGPAFGISSGIVGLASLVAAALAGCFGRQSLQGLNWDFLIGYGVILSLAPIVTSLGIDDSIATTLRELIGGFQVNPLFFVLAVALLNITVRFALPDDQTLLLLGIVLLPMAPIVGVHPWIVIITLLATFTLWIFPGQTIGYTLAYEAAEERLFTHAQARQVCFGYITVTLVGLMLVLPYWRLLGLVR